jgi:hypothetical protein
MLERRAFVAGLGGVAMAGAATGAPYRPRLAVLVGVPWAAKGETWLGNGVAMMREALRARGVGPRETIASTEPLDREGLLRRLADVKRRIASWRDGEVFFYYDGHGMYRRQGSEVPEAGLQLTPDRDSPSSALLWRELWDALGAPPGVRVLTVPDCCHTNLLARRALRNVSALIMKSEPQDTLACRTGGAFFGEGAARLRYGVISYYAGSTLAAANTFADWLGAMDAAAGRDMATGTLEARRRVPLMIEGDASAILPGRPLAMAASPPPTKR